MWVVLPPVLILGCHFLLLCNWNHYLVYQLYLLCIFSIHGDRQKISLLRLSVVALRIWWVTTSRNSDGINRGFFEKKSTFHQDNALAYTSAVAIAKLVKLYKLLPRILKIWPRATSICLNSWKQKSREIQFEWWPFT